MSNENNTIWLEAARDNFNQAVDENNFTLAQAIVEDIRDAGFTSDAYALDDLLAEITRTSE